MLDDNGEFDIEGLGTEGLKTLQAAARWFQRRLDEFNSARYVEVNTNYVEIERTFHDGCHCHGETSYKSVSIPTSYFFSGLSASEFIRAEEGAERAAEEARQKNAEALRKAQEIEAEKRQLEALRKKYG